ncbi:hypothetical protein NQ317_013611 [Molorchus minor]|uniref:Tectonic-1 n=1 Tax=Molorchus minor TaxID=1323400 RepID=A0ABQ9J4U6_9CUCU|nr:hypothetical protein NQ317_013611 [Molorchus minor]
MYLNLWILMISRTIAQNSEKSVTVGPTNSTAVTAYTESTDYAEDQNIDFNVTTEMALTTCDVNCSLSGNESVVNTTEVANSANRDGIPNGRIDTKVTKLQRNKGLCICDVHLNFCDINCCCDDDCSSEDKLIFHHCETENLHYDTSYCDYMKYIYINNTPFEWRVNQNGLFCVVKSNLPPSYTVQRKQPLRSIDDAELEKHNKFSWPKYFTNREAKFSSNESFVHGSKVWIVQKDGIRTFQLPSRLMSNTCAFKDDIKNFVNFRSVCPQVDISEENRLLNLDNIIQNVSVVAAPYLLNISKYKNIFQECPRNTCLTVLPKICQKNFHNCQNISRNDTRLKVTCNFDIRSNKNRCKNVVKNIQYNFYHKGSKGYKKIELLVYLENVTYEFGTTDYELYQEFEVNFWWMNQTKNLSEILSGNPGYLIGKPILTGNVINLGNKTNFILKIERFPADYVKTFIVVPDNVNGDCILNGTKYLPVEFGYNMLTKCKFTNTIFNRKRYFNGTEVCRNIQKSILELWGITGKNKTVGMFGNANANKPEEWIQILYQIAPQKLLNKTVGKFSKSNDSVTCFGLVTNLVVDIYHSKIDFPNLLNQEKILAVSYTFRGFTNKTLVYNKQKNSTSFEIDLESQVVFYDISAQKHRKFVDPPSLEIKLPYDFFYPFIKIENGVGDKNCFAIGLQIKNGAKHNTMTIFCYNGYSQNHIDMLIDIDPSGCPPSPSPEDRAYCRNPSKCRKKC